jgi:hypothetical protein
MGKPTVILIGADKGGVGKTTVARTLLEYFSKHEVPTRAFDTETPKGTLQRFHPDVSEIVDVTAVADQMRIFDTVSDTSVTVIDVRAGLLSSTLRALRDISFLDTANEGQLTFIVFHILGSSIASLDEIEETASLTTGGRHFMVKNFINDASFFEWDQAIHKSYFKKSRYAEEVTVPRLLNWPTNKWNSHPFPSPPLSPIRAGVGKRSITRLFCADMFDIGPARFGMSTTASS